MNDLFYSAASVILRISPNFILLIIITRNFSLNIASVALYAITVCTLLCAFIDYGLNDKFNKRCADTNENIFMCFREFLFVRISSAILIFTLLLTLNVVTDNSALFKICLTYFPLSVIFLIQSLMFSVIRYRLGFRHERNLQTIHSFLNISGMFLAGLFSHSIISLFFIILVFRLLLIIWLYRQINFSEKLKFRFNAPQYYSFLKDNFYWFVAHALSILHLNIDIILLEKIMTNDAFVIYQIMVRLFLSATLIGLAANPVLIKQFTRSISKLSFSIRKSTFIIIYKASVLFFLIGGILSIIPSEFYEFIFGLESPSFKQSDIYLLSGFFVLRVSAWPYNVAFVFFDKSSLKVIGSFFSVLMLSSCILIFRPQVLNDALLILFITSFIELVFRHVILYFNISDSG